MLISLPARRIADTVSLPPSERPAAELPEYEPTAADLAVIELASHINLEAELDEHLARVTTLCAVESRHRELMRLREDLGIDGLPVDEPEHDRYDEHFEPFSSGCRAA